MIKPKVVLLIFVSGKIVLTGAKVCNDQDVHPVYVLIKFVNRSEKKFTRRSTQSTLCFVNSANLNHAACGASVFPSLYCLMLFYDFEPRTKSTRFARA